MGSDKEKTNKKWTSSDKYKDNYDRIFRKKDEQKQEDEEKSENN